MKIVFIGSGNVASILGRRMIAAGHHILQVFSRNASTASELAYEWDTESTNYKSLINKSADVYIIAVPDDNIKQTAEDLHLDGKIVVHTAASVPASVLKNVSENFGVFYPLQTFREGSPLHEDFPMFIDGSNEQTRSKLALLASSITPSKVSIAGDAERLKMHVAAVMVSNFTNHLYALAEEYCRKEGLDFSNVIPLLIETAQRAGEMSPALAQTGPAIRHDRETILKHLELLSSHPHIRNIYLLMTESIQQHR